ncbi:hypothetical protein [Jeotgalibacillus haloalkalitolerans]|uniref:Uncharacterized protein n=1 Tax=Jeotgalibacillus haloalkalitolerans TaxID=3104292 RepID=A0ABU5KJE1_9BACL|nr:hypothetical protein [Jeotgalibacillus sp. HH7-29]MDZ5711368.1 hypothetical protein [Jeotgalibacillus sp. HH7-29]
MNTTTKSILLGTIVSAGTFTAITGYQKRKKNKASGESFETLEDTDMRNSVKVEEENVNANVDHAEQNLTQLDAAYRADWQAN